MNRRNALKVIGSGVVTLAARGQSSPKLSVDKHGLIVQVDGDGGDTAQREGWAWFGSWIRDNVLHNPWDVKRLVPNTNEPFTFEKTMAFLEVDQTGVFRRHPDQWNDPKDFSRDQTIPIVAAMGVWNDKARLDRLWNRTKGRNYLAQNGDLISPEAINLFDRARGEQPGLPGDIQLAASVWARIGQSLNNRDDVGDDLNLVIILVMSKLRSSNSTTDSAVAAYAKNRPISYGCYLQSYRQKNGVDLKASAGEVRRRMEESIDKPWKPDCPRVLGALRWYFRAETGGNPELAELYAPIVKQWLE
jgi:hypothetical protein